MPGLSIALSKQPPSGVRLQGISPMEVIETCKASGLDLHTVELKGQSSLRDASVAIYRGISYRGARLPPDGDGDHEDDMLYNDGRSRFVMLRYFLDGQHAGASLHYVVGVDRTKQVLLFEMSWIVRYPSTKKFGVQCHLGPYAGPAFGYFKLMGDQEAAVQSARNLEWILNTEYLMDRLIPPAVLMPQLDNLSGLYIALAGPGTGKTRVRLAGVVKYLTENARFNMCLAQNTKARDNLLHMLHDILSKEDFDTRVRVEGHSHLDDPLVRSWTL